MMKTLVETVAELIKKKPAELTLQNVKESIPGIQRKAAEYEREALAAERRMLGLREKAFQAGGNPSDQAALIRQAGQDKARADTLARQAGVFVQHLASLRSLETTMEIVEELKSVGLLKPGQEVRDWQKVMDEMAVEIGNTMEATQKLRDVIDSVLPSAALGEGASAPEKELEELFKRYNAAGDPAEKNRIRVEIDRRTGLAAAGQV